MNVQTLIAPVIVGIAAATTGAESPPGNPPDFPIPVGGLGSIVKTIVPLTGCPEESY